LREFTEFTADLYDTDNVPEPGSYDIDEFESEYDQFVDWFAETYEEQMTEYLSELTEAEKTLERLNEKSSKDALDTNMRSTYSGEEQR